MDKIIIYTDGACSGNQSKENIGGWGAILIYKDKEKEIYGGEINTTNNRMELTAVIESLKTIKNRSIQTELYTDSAYICNCIIQKWYVNWEKNGWKNAKKQDVENQDLWKELLMLYRAFNYIEFYKVKGHSGVEYNEKADELANKGIELAKKDLK